MSMTLLATLGIVVMIVLILLGMNVGMSMLLVGFVGYGFALNFNAALGILQSMPMANAMTYTFTVIPLFILMGQFTFRAGLSSGLFDAANKWLGRIRGGLGIATTAACGVFGAISGSLAASTATMSVIAMPEMRRHKYDDALAAGCIASAGTLGTLIPPSSPFIMYGIIAEVSIGRLFAAGVIPGIIMAICFSAVFYVIALKSPERAPRGDKFTWKEKFASLKGIIPVGILFLLVIGGMFTGWFSTTEAAAAGAVFSFILMAIHKEASWKNIWISLMETAKTTGMSLFIVIGAMQFGYFLTVTGLPATLANWVSSLHVHRLVIIAIIILIYGLMGCVMDAAAMTLLTIPIFLPIIKKLGFDPVWFGVIIVMVQNLGAITPPVGMSCFIAAGTIKDVPLSTVFRGAVPFVFAFAVSFVIVAVWPQLSLWLPNLLYG